MTLEDEAARAALWWEQQDARAAERERLAVALKGDETAARAARAAVAPLVGHRDHLEQLEGLEGAAGGKPGACR